MGTSVTVRCAARLSRRGWARLAGFLVVLLASPAAATPTFELGISTGGVAELAVGQTLQLRAFEPSRTCLPAPYVGGKRKPARPAAARVVWSVTPPDCATVTEEGLLTAVKESVITVHVACREPNAASCSMTDPGRTWLALLNDLPAGRLPRLDGGPAGASFLLTWDATPYQSLHELDIAMNGAAGAWGAGMHTSATPDHAFPWTFEIASSRRSFDDDEGYDGLHGEARHRANVTAARLTLDGWKDGIVSGRILLTTTRGVDFDTTFQSRLPDRDGVLARGSAAALRAEPK